MDKGRFKRLFVPAKAVSVGEINAGWQELPRNHNINIFLRS
jgi:hypothetical protein